MGRGEWHNAGLDLFCLWLNVGPAALAVRSELEFPPLMENSCSDVKLPRDGEGGFALM